MAKEQRCTPWTPPTSTISNLYDHDCAGSGLLIGEQCGDGWLYYLHDAAGTFATGGYVRQGVDAEGAILI